MSPGGCGSPSHPAPLIPSAGGSFWDHFGTVSWTKMSKHIPVPFSSGLRSSRSGSGSGKTGTEQGGRSGKLCRVPGAGPGGSGDVPVPGCAVRWDAPSGKCRLCYSHGKSGNTGPKRPSETSLGSAGVTSTSWGPQGAAGAAIGERPAGKREFRLQWDRGRRTGIQGDSGAGAARTGCPGWESRLVLKQGAQGQGGIHLSLLNPLLNHVLVREWGGGGASM